MYIHIDIMYIHIHKNSFQK